MCFIQPSSGVQRQSVNQWGRSEQNKRDRAEVISLRQVQRFQSVRTIIRTTRQRGKAKTSQQGLRVLGKHIPQSGVCPLSQGCLPSLCRLLGRADTRSPLSCISETGAPWPHLTNIERKDSSEAAQIKMDQGFKTNYQSIISLRWAG